MQPARRSHSNIYLAQEDAERRKHEKIGTKMFFFLFRVSFTNCHDGKAPSAEVELSKLRKRRSGHANRKRKKFICSGTCEFLLLFKVMTAVLRGHRRVQRHRIMQSPQTNVHAS